MEPRKMSKTVKRRLRRERQEQVASGDFVPFNSQAVPTAPVEEQKPKLTKSAKRAARKRKKLAMLEQDINEKCSSSNNKPEVVIKKPKLIESPSKEKDTELCQSDNENLISPKTEESEKGTESSEKPNLNEIDNVEEHDNSKHENSEDCVEQDKESSEKVTKTKKNLPPKKRRYVLFVGNLSYESKEEDIMEHFKKVGPIVSVRLAKRKDSNASRGFCHLELGDEVTYLKALSLHHSFLNKRRINVEYSSGQAEEKSVIKQKNMKLHTLKKTGVLGGKVVRQTKRAKKFKSKSVQKSRGEFFV